MRDRIELLQRHRKTCEVCWYVPIDKWRDFCPVGRMLAEDVVAPATACARCGHAIADHGDPNSPSFVMPCQRCKCRDLVLLRVIATGPISRWWRFCSWLGRGLARVI